MNDLGGKRKTKILIVSTPIDEDKPTLQAFLNAAKRCEAVVVSNPEEAAKLRAPDIKTDEFYRGPLGVPYEPKS